MPDDSAPDSFAPDSSAQDTSAPDTSVPDAALSPEQIDEIAAQAVPATIRRAPKYKSFFWVGALVGIVVGVWFGLWVSTDGMINRWIYVTVTAVGVTMVTVLLAGLAAVWADRRSTRPRR
ncbi:hypothetical protein SAMN05216410_1024 [Sanguibacter gelidistatuariae]|uniref:Uncharacterized protein n=1 Tax=Sanguibacter gelidistatuariae TaxID=1814289 RepID=A0A1G6HGW0_9MICO|nr:hypothetical protein SAMN05216410_1024 [Sanguibacter gelidistatuariae]